MYNKIALDFIEENKDKLNNNDFIFFYWNLPAGVQASDFTEIFIDANIDFLHHLNWIPEDCFYGLTNVYDVDIPNNISEIGSYAFAQSGIEQIVIPKSVENINTGAFFNCPNLKEVWLPKIDGFLNVDAFDKCNNLKHIYYEGSEKDWMDLIQGQRHSLDYYLNPDITTVHFNSY